MRKKIARIWGGKKFEYYRLINPNSGKSMAGVYDTGRMAMLFKENDEVIQLRVGKTQSGEDFYEGDFLDCVIFDGSVENNIILSSSYCEENFCFVFKDINGNILARGGDDLIVKRVVGNIFEKQNNS